MKTIGNGQGNGLSDVRMITNASKKRPYSFFLYTTFWDYVGTK